MVSDEPVTPGTGDGPATGSPMPADPADPGDIDPGYARFIELFNRGEFWESHEALEEAWRETGSEFYHALILYASAFVHAKRGNRHGIGAQLAKAEEKLAAYPHPYLGVDVDGIRDHIRRCLEILDALPDTGAGTWPERLPPPALELRVERVRGDEPELG